MEQNHAKQESFPAVTTAFLRVWENWEPDQISIIARNGISKENGYSYHWG